MLQDEVRDLAFGLAPFLAVHLGEQVEGAHQEVAAPAGGVQQGHLAQRPSRPPLPLGEGLGEGRFPVSFTS